MGRSTKILEVIANFIPSSEPRRLLIYPSTIAHSDSTYIIMLPHQSSNLHHGHHRRQQSTPTAFDNLKISSPARHAAHHRGLSFDQTMRCHGLPDLEIYQQDPTTNTNPRHMQHVISETQQRPMARPGQQRHNSDDGTIRPFRFPIPASTGCFKTDLSQQQISDMTDDQIYQLFASRLDQGEQHSFQPALSAGSLDGNGYNSSAVAGTTQNIEEAAAIEIPDSIETSRRSSVQYATIMPQRPYTPPTQTNRCEIEPTLGIWIQQLTLEKMPSL